MLCNLKNVLACSVFTVLASTFGRMSSDPSKVTHSGHSVQCWVCPFSLWRLWLDYRTAPHWLSLLGRLILYLCSGFFTLTTLECERKVRQSNTGGWCWMFSHDYGLWLKNETVELPRVLSSVLFDGKLENPKYTQQMRSHSYFNSFSQSSTK